MIKGWGIITVPVNGILPSYSVSIKMFAYITSNAKHQSYMVTVTFARTYKAL